MPSDHDHDRNRNDRDSDNLVHGDCHNSRPFDMQRSAGPVLLRKRRRVGDDALWQPIRWGTVQIDMLCALRNMSAGPTSNLNSSPDTQSCAGADRAAHPAAHSAPDQGPYSTDNAAPQHHYRDHWDYSYRHHRHHPGADGRTLPGARPGTNASPAATHVQRVAR